ncbi:MAG: hypothetical protein ACYCV0_00475 [Desulfitobacteriaceae bacterium]
MKKIKLLKWKIGVIGAIGITVLFNSIKAGPEFQQASANASLTNNSSGIVEPQDPVQCHLYAQSPGTDDQNSLAPFNHDQTPRFHSKTRRS